MNLQAAREQMVEQQVRAWDVLDERVLQTMLQVQREEFAPLRYRDVAFADAAIPLAHGQSMLPAKVHGRILQALEVTEGSVALEVGAGTGYLSACLGKLASRVRSFEIFPDLAEQARANLLAARINNVSVEAADAMQLNEQSAYDVIAVTGSLPIYDERFQQALRIGGRLFVVGGSGRRCSRPCSSRWSTRRAHRHSCSDPVTFALPAGSSPHRSFINWP
jgi:protein-L-isoaspartate(D-aspartate) O-methyltransferase